MADETKPGIKTSEFWVAVITPVIVGALHLFGVEMTDPQIAMIIAPVLTYIWGRAFIKGKASE